MFRNSFQGGFVTGSSYITHTKLFLATGAILMTVTFSKYLPGFVGLLQCNSCHHFPRKLRGLITDNSRTSTPRIRFFKGDIKTLSKTVENMSPVISYVLRTQTFSIGFFSSDWRKNYSTGLLFTRTIYVVCICLCIMTSSHAYQMHVLFTHS